MTDKEIYQLRIEVRCLLENLNPTVYPYFAGLSKSMDGLNQAEAIVLAYVARNLVEPHAAVAQLESDYGD